MTQPPLNATILPVTPYQQNCSLVWCTATRRGAVIDPGGEIARIRQAAAAQGVTIEKVLLTHGHLDHASGAAELARELGVKIEGPHRDDLFLLERLGENARRPGFTEAENCLPDRWLEDGDTVTVGEVELGVRHCPGHTPGHVVLFHQEAKIAFVGDVLFKGSVGRTDFPARQPPATGRFHHRAAVAAGRRHALRAGARRNVHLRLGAEDQPLCV